MALIETRRLGLAGEALGHFAIALVQGLIVMIGSALIFGVNWGNPFGAALNRGEEAVM